MASRLQDINYYCKMEWYSSDVQSTNSLVRPFMRTSMATTCKLRDGLHEVRDKVNKLHACGAITCRINSMSHLPPKCLPFCQSSEGLG